MRRKKSKGEFDCTCYISTIVMLKGKIAIFLHIESERAVLSKLGSDSLGL
jgi:hypothetical protein